MRKRLLMALALGALMVALTACGGSAARAPVGDRSERLAWTPKTHRVKPGDTLYSVAWQYGLDYQTLARWNWLEPPYKIVIGKTLRLRAPPRSTPPTRQTRTEPVKPKPKTKPKTSPAKPTQRQAKAAPVQALPSGPIRWRWPADGKIVRTFQANSYGKKGIDIAGRGGQPVRAAAAGRVVYSGSGLVGYGRLIIIKHNKRFLSAYGHNRKLFAKEGTQVLAGQVIAEMGSSGASRPQLHFEIRKDGKPVDPIRYLPRR